MIIDCDDCALQGTSACQDCVVSALFDLVDPVAPAQPVELGDDAARALHHLADAGLVAPIRLVPRHRRRDAATG